MPPKDENDLSSDSSSDEDLLAEMFTDRSTTNSDKDDELTVSLDWDDKSLSPSGNDSVRSERTSDTSSFSTPRAMASAPSSSKTYAIESLPVLSRGVSHSGHFENPLHKVGRTRVPWHSKSVSDLRDPESRPTRVVAFDVGGKLFRCKESLIAKHPLKRLNQIITCGCGKIGCLDDAFFIDRNPQHFEMILDWYRTGKLVRQRNVNEEAFKDDAIYFDLYDELFPDAPAASSTSETLPSQSSKAHPGVPTRRRSVNDMDSTVKTLKRVSMFATMATKQVSTPPSHTKTVSVPNKVMSEKELAVEVPSKPKIQEPQGASYSTSPDDGQMHFFRRERRVLTGASIPLVFKVRDFERLLVESVKGHGKLMVRVCDVTGMQSVEVPEAVLFDSHSRFYLEGRRAQLEHNALLPGNHVYTFWMEEHPDASSVQSSAPAMLDIEFKLLFTFDHSDRLTDAVETKLTDAMADGNSAIPNLAPEGTLHSNSKTESFSPCLFMPPSQLQRSPESGSPSKATQTNTAKMLPPVSQKKNGVKRGDRENQHEQTSRTMRHAGAAIVRGGQQPYPRPAEGKITIYRTTELDIDPANDHNNTLLSLHQGKHSSERKSINQAVETAYRDMQPRLFP
ncbi:hypothetical protein PHYBOEH_004256 [Phytophthora boehmeriae]|uniref:Potassium channel tetramerisation-type BTB domain-containing protein n=1 Tax=Phytophthora boehmeriae TaxID=109152 RepID=A0A8T1WTG3_9STRA|nr:hypothetical protein PHYBOEH_004256 [Phytophthora boehmeriae]